VGIDTNGESIECSEMESKNLEFFDAFFYNPFQKKYHSMKKDVRYSEF
jgi:hypothetical protein